MQLRSCNGDLIFDSDEEENVVKVHEAPEEDDFYIYNDSDIETVDLTTSGWD